MMFKICLKIVPEEESAQNADEINLVMSQLLKMDNGGWRLIILFSLLLYFGNFSRYRVR